MRLRNRVAPLLLATALSLHASSVAAQVPPPATLGGVVDNPFSSGVPGGERQSAPLSLSLSDALARGLQHNLAVITREEDVAFARGARREALTAVLPNVSGRLATHREVVNLEAMGFSGFPGIPSIIGPFNVVDARLSVSQPIIDISGNFRIREAAEQVQAAQHTYRNVRDLVVLAVTNLYLQALTAESRVQSMKAQVDTAAALATLADDRRSSGLVPAIDVLRAQVQHESERQRLIAAENAAAKQKLALARAIGLPLGQAFVLADQMPESSAEVPSLETALQQAYAHREDLKAQVSAVSAAEAATKTAGAERLPSVGVDGNWGPIGQTAGTAIPTYSVAATVRVPIFSGGRTGAHIAEAAATLSRRRAELEAMRARIHYDVEAALLDLDAARQLVDVTARSVILAEQQLTQARDRFAAGVVDTIEVVQAQESLAAAHDAQVGSLYSYNAAKAALATAMGLAEEEMPRVLGVTRQ